MLAGRFLHRLPFLIGFVFLAGADGLCAEATPASPPIRIRIVSGNLTSGRYQSYDPGHGSRIFQGLKPDICAIQELNFANKSDSAAREWVRSVFGPNFSFFREIGEIPNGIVSRWNIVASGEWDDPLVTNRDFAWARIDIPGGRDLWVISVHLLTKSQARRAQEADALVQFVKEQIPERDYLVLGGDLNTQDRHEPCLQQLASQFVVNGPYPVDEGGKEGTNTKRLMPYDWILADVDFEKCKTPVVIGTHTFRDGFVFDSRVFSTLPDVAPVQREDSAADQMQHMAVVRDFLVPQEP